MANNLCKNCKGMILKNVFICPVCGVLLPLVRGKKLSILILITIVLPILVSGLLYENTEQGNKPQSVQESSIDVENAKNYLEGLDWVVEASYIDYATVKWHIAIEDNGRNAIGSAQAVCEMLRQRDLVDSTTIVRMVDIKKVFRGENFRNSSLGRVQCSTGEPAYP